MRIGITGAAGHVGNNVSLALAEQGHDLRLMVNRSHKGLDHLNAELFSCDLLDADQVRAFTEGMDVIIHTAARISIDPSDAEQVWAVNVKGTEHIVQACLHTKPQRLIHFSTIHAFDPFPLEEPLDETRPVLKSGGTAYDRSKIRAEEIVLEAAQAGLNAVVLSPSSVFGPNDQYPSLLGRAIIDLYKGRMPALIPGGYNFVFVEDIAQATVAALKEGRSGEKYLLSGHYLSLKKLAEEIHLAGGRRRWRPILPTALLKLLLPFFALQGKLQGQPPLITSESLKILNEGPQDVRFDKAAKELGYQARPFPEALRLTLEWFQENRYL